MFTRNGGINDCWFLLSKLISDKIPQIMQPTAVRNTKGFIRNESIRLNCDKYRTERVPPQVRQGIWVKALKGQVNGNFVKAVLDTSKLNKPTADRIKIDMAPYISPNCVLVLFAFIS
ncbi:MAG: hypothetical protein WC980_05955 [Candidatus Brocadiia bacterium]